MERGGAKKGRRGGEEEWDGARRRKESCYAPTYWSSIPRSANGCYDPTSSSSILRSSAQNGRKEGGAPSPCCAVPPERATKEVLLPRVELSDSVAHKRKEGAPSRPLVGLSSPSEPQRRCYDPALSSLIPRRTKRRKEGAPLRPLVVPSNPSEAQRRCYAAQRRRSSPSPCCRPA